MAHNFCKWLNYFPRINYQDGSIGIALTRGLVVTVCRTLTTEISLYDSKLVISTPKGHSALFKRVNNTKADKIFFTVRFGYVLVGGTFMIRGTLAKFLRASYVVKYVATPFATVSSVHTAFNNFRRFLSFLNRIEFRPFNPEQLNSHAAIIGGQNWYVNSNGTVSR